MKRAKDLSQNELEKIVDQIQQALWLVYSRGKFVWNYDKEWDECTIDLVSAALGPELRPDEEKEVPFVNLEDYKPQEEPPALTCECFDSGSGIYGILVPGDWDVAPCSRDGRVFVTRHDECGVFVSDIAAAEWLGVLLGVLPWYWVNPEEPEAALKYPYLPVKLAEIERIAAVLRTVREAQNGRHR